MPTSPLQDLQTLLSSILTSHSILRQKLTRAQSAIHELQRQNKELTGLLAESHTLIQKQQAAVTRMHAIPNTAAPLIPIPTNPLPVPKNPNWIDGSWLTPSDPLLAPAETAWVKSSPQIALSYLSHLLTSPTLVPSLRVNAILLLSAILRSNGSLPLALMHAEEALQLAQGVELGQDLVGKAQFQRGLCCLHLKRWADASWCFVLARGTEGYEEVVEVQWGVAEGKRKGCRVGDRGGIISEGFL